MTKIAIFDTVYAWDWLVTLNRFIDGVTWGAGVLLVFLLFVLYVNKAGKKKDDSAEGGGE